MGFSENLIGNNNQPMQMYWQTYNHDKTYWNGGVNWLVGDELTAANIGEDGFLSIFSGTGMGRNMDNWVPTPLYTALVLAP